VSSTAPSEAFQKLQFGLRAQCEPIAAALQGEATQRRWMLPEGLANVSLFSPQDFEKGFDRQEANADYEAALNRDGTIGEGAAARIQVDYMAMQERAFRSRHTTPVRAMAHAACRRRGHADPAGVHQGVVVQHVADVQKAGKKAAG
jgi:hypothetical protein